MVVGCTLPAGCYSYSSCIEVAFDSLVAVDIVSFDVAIEMESSGFFVEDIVSSARVAVDRRNVKRVGDLEVGTEATH